MRIYKYSREDAEKLCSQAARVHSSARIFAQIIEIGHLVVHSCLDIERGWAGLGWHDTYLVMYLI